MKRAHLNDGTELFFPDDMEDEEVDLRVKQFHDRGSVKDAIEALRVSQREIGEAIVKAILTPRQLERDAMGRPQRAVPVPPKARH